MTQIGTLSLNGIFHEDSIYTFLLKAGIVEADVGKAVALDATAANTVKLAGDGDIVIGRLDVVEDRVTEGVLVGSVVTQGGMKFPVDNGILAGDIPDVGEYLSGSTTAGSVKGSATLSRWLVVEMATDDTYAIAISV